MTPSLYLKMRTGTAALAAFALVVSGLSGCRADPGPDGGGAPDIAAASGPPEIHKVTVGALPITDLKQLFVADAEGFFRREGLTVEIKNFDGGAAIVPAVESGSADLGWSNSISILQARARGLDVRFFAGGLYQGPGHWTSAIMVPENSPIRRPEQLRGHQIAINTLGNINELAMRAYLDRHGIGADAVQFIEVPFPDQPAALQAGRVDVAVPTEPFVTVARQQGARLIDAEPFSAIGPRPFVAAFFAKEGWLRANPNTAAAFRRAVNQATKWWHAHPERHAEVIARYTKVPPALTRQIGLGDPRTEIAETDLQSQIELSSRYGLLPRPIAARDVLAR